MILVLTGPVRSGKTSLLRKLLPQLKVLRVPVHGYLSPSVMIQGKAAGYDLFDVAEGKSIPFLRTEGEDGWQKVGPYYLLPHGLKTAEATILSYKPGEILIVDEVGPMELSGRGIWPALSEVLSRPSLDCLLVVRKPLLNNLWPSLGRATVRVFDIEERDVYPSLIQALSRLKARRNRQSVNDNVTAIQKRRVAR